MTDDEIRALFKDLREQVQRHGRDNSLIYLCLAMLLLKGCT